MLIIYLSISLYIIVGITHLFTKENRGHLSYFNKTNAPLWGVVLYRLSGIILFSIIWPIYYIPSPKSSTKPLIESVPYTYQLSATFDNLKEQICFVTPYNRIHYLINYTDWVPYADVRVNDEIWTFKTSDGSWAHLAGREGYALIRDKKIIAEIVTVMN